jgi:hypothetical protein
VQKFATKSNQQVTLLVNPVVLPRLPADETPSPAEDRLPAVTATPMTKRIEIKDMAGKDIHSGKAPII